ncbi:NAD-dependent epimerase/dehydratase family protein, partial [bacterium]|nr:NAD-dependent epimerase/dehydratase family protein [bacterium]
YALTKYAGERYCQIFYQLYGLETVCLRYFNVFGPNQNPNSEYSAVIPKFINLMLSKQSPVIYGDGLQSRDFTYIENVINANLLACNTDRIAGQVFNIASGERFSLSTLVEKVNKILNSNITPTFAPPRAGDVEHSLADIKKTKEYMNYEPTVRFEEGLRRLIDHLNHQKI